MMIRHFMMMLALTGLFAFTAQATVLTFDRVSSPFSSGSALPQDYGDNVAAAIQGDYSYGTDHGLTPNVTVEYGGGPPPVNGFAVYWGPDFGDLTGVLEAESEPIGLQIRLVAEPGYQVQLHGFDMAGWPAATYTINSVRVRDADDNILFEALNPTILGAGPSHSDFDFPNLLTDEVIKIEWDSTNLGGSSDNIGIDNIAFSQIPEPASLALLGLTGLVICGRRR